MRVNVFTYILAGIMGFILLFGVSLFFQFVGYNNRYQELRTSFEAENSVMRISHDKMSKVISQQAQVPVKERETLLQIVTASTEGRKGGEMFKMVQESNLNISQEAFVKLMNSISAERAAFMESQKKAIDVAREGNTLLRTFPGSFFLVGKPEFKVQLVTSSATEKAFETGKDDDTELF